MDIRWGKALSAAALSVSLLFGACSGHGTAAASEITILLDGVPLPFDAAPVIKQGVTLVPFRPIAEAMGISVAWEAASHTVQAEEVDAKGTKVKVSLEVGRGTASVNGASISLPAAPVITNGRVLIPLAFFGRQFGAQIGWDGVNKTVIIRSPLRKMRMLGFYAIRAFDQKDMIPSFDDVAFGWGMIDSKGELTFQGEGDSKWKWPDAAGDVTPESLVQQVNEQSSDSYLAVNAVDGQGQLTKLLTDMTLRDDSIAKLAETAKDKGFKGILLDLEGLGYKTDPVQARAELNDYVKALVDKVSSEGIKVSVAVPPPNGSYHGYDYRSLAAMADELMLMAYDYDNPKLPQSDAKVNQAILLTLGQGVSKNKLLLGINLDSENENSIDDKLGLAKRYGLLGVAFWRIGLFTDAENRVIHASVVKEGN